MSSLSLQLNQKLPKAGGSTIHGSNFLSQCRGNTAWLPLAITMRINLVPTLEAPSIYLGPQIIIIESIRWSHIGEQKTVSWIITFFSDNLMTGSSGANQEFSNKSIINIIRIIYRESTM